MLSDLGPLFRSKLTIVWAILVAATLLSWVGTTTGSGSLLESASVLAIAVAFFKMYLVGDYFMELRGGPDKVRKFFLAYCVSVCLVLCAIYLITT